VSLDHLLDAEARQEHLAPVRKSASGYPNMTALAATCSRVADAAQNIMICAVGVSSHEINEIAHIDASSRVGHRSTDHACDRSR
jgi:hypothetical protein